MDNDFGPKWCMTSEEVGSGFAIFIIFIGVIFIFAPAFFLGTFVGGNDMECKNI